MEGTKKKKLIVIGNGMTGYKFCEKFVEHKLISTYDILVIGEEPRPAYDRVHLTNYYKGTSVEKLTLAPREWYEHNGIELITHESVTTIDRNEKKLTTNKHQSFEYDTLVMATGSSAYLPPIDGIHKRGVFAYRNIEQLDAIKEFSLHIQKAVVIGGGLLGLEAAKALKNDGLQVTIVEQGQRLMARQMDEKGAKIIQEQLRGLNIDVLTNTITSEITGEDNVTGLRFVNGLILPTEMVVISAGIKPRDELARKACLRVGEKGGIAVNDQMMTSDSSIYAIGECVFSHGMVWDWVGACYDMAEVAASQISGGNLLFKGRDLPGMEVEDGY